MPLSRFLGRLRASKDSVKNDVWRARTAWKIEAWRKRAEQLRVDDPDEYQRILGLATEEAGVWLRKTQMGLSPSSLPIPGTLDRGTVPTALDNGRRSPKKLLRPVVARLLGRR